MYSLISAAIILLLNDVSESEVAQSCLTLFDPMDCSIRPWLLCPWDFQDKSTGVGCLKNPMDRGDLRATVHGVSKSQT